MKKVIAAALVAVAFAVPVAAQTPTLHIDKKPIAAVLAAGYADMLTTQLNLHVTPGAYEQNPLVPSAPTANLVVGSAGYVGAAVAVYLLERHGHPKLAKAFGYGMASVGATCAVRNARLGKLF